MSVYEDRCVRCGHMRRDHHGMGRIGTQITYSPLIGKCQWKTCSCEEYTEEVSA